MKNLSTQIINLGTTDSNQAVALAQASFRSNLPVAVPTETVYGLAAPFNDYKTIQAIYHIKKRPQDNPLIVHISNLAQLNSLISLQLPANLQELIAKFWPGPLTLLLPKSDQVPEIVTAQSDLVAVRMPKSQFMLDLIDTLKTPLVAPSANLSGKPSPTTATDVLEDLSSQILYIFDDQQTEFGVESTVLKPDRKTDFKQATICRPGVITLQDLNPFFTNIDILQSTAEDTQVISPGTKYRHYAPTAKIVLIEAISQFDQALLSQSSRLLTYQPAPTSPFITQFQDENHLMKNLFSTFRQLDRQQVETIYIEKPLQNLALLDRIIKASSSS